MACCGGLIKCVFGFINLLFVILGLGLVGVAIWLKVDPQAWYYLRVANYAGEAWGDIAIYVAIGVGVFILIVAGTGLLGACKMNSCLLTTYAVLVVLVIITQVALGAFAVIFQQTMAGKLKEEMKNQIQNHYDEPGFKLLTEAWNAMQVKVICCGGNNFTDYRGSKYDNKTILNTVPPTCCRLNNDNPDDPDVANLNECQNEVNSGPNTDLHRLGCYDKLYKWVIDKAYILIGVGFGFILFQVLGVVFACCLRKEASELGYRK